MALVTARRAAVGDGWGPGFRLAAAKRCADVAEAISGRDPHLAAAALCAASESALAGGRVDVALVHAREVRGGGVDGDERGHPGRPRVHLGGEVRVGVRGCVLSRGGAPIGDFRRGRGRRAVASHAPAVTTRAGGTGSSFESSTAAAAPRVVSAAGDVAAASFALLPGATVDVPSGSSTALTMAAACASLAVGDFKAAEALLRDAQRGAVELAESSGGVQPLCAAASKALLGAALLARAKPTEVGGGGDPKAAKEAGKVLARAMRGAGFGTTLAAACGTLGVEAELAKGGGGEGTGRLNAVGAGRLGRGWRRRRPRRRTRPPHSCAGRRRAGGRTRRRLCTRRPGRLSTGIGCGRDPITTDEQRLESGCYLFCQRN